LWGKKEEVCLDEEKEEYGDQWDHVVIDSESKAVISMVNGKRTKENTEILIRDFAGRVNEGKPPRLFTTDDYPCYKEALLSVYGKWVSPERTGKRGRPRKPYQIISDMQYVTVKKHRKRGHVVSVETEQVYGTKDELADTLKLSLVSNAVNISFVERQNGTDRHLNSRKARKTLEFSKEHKYHTCQSWLCMTYYNFCWDHRSLRTRTIHRSPMVALGVTDHIWLIEEMVSYQTIKDH